MRGPQRRLKKNGLVGRTAAQGAASGGQRGTGVINRLIKGFGRSCRLMDPGIESCSRGGRRRWGFFGGWGVAETTKKRKIR